jgi:methionyl aminopeptidase
MTVSDQSDVDALVRVGAVVAEARDAMGARVAAGVSTAELDALGREILERHGARSAPQLAYGFPGATCISVNDELAHGVPSRSRVLREGDLVNIDVSAELDGYWADTGASFGVGRIEQKVAALLWAARQSLDDALLEVQAGKPLKNIARAVERRARRSGFQVVRDLCGHGVGRHIHEEPSVPNTTHGRDRTVLWEGLVITIEPFLTTSARSFVEDDDGWTLRTPDGSHGAQFEHTLIVTRGAPLIVTESRARAA